MKNLIQNIFNNSQPILQKINNDLFHLEIPEPPKNIKKWKCMKQRYLRGILFLAVIY